MNYSRNKFNSVAFTFGESAMGAPTKLLPISLPDYAQKSGPANITGNYVLLSDE
jgi:hypothetical protein